MISSLSIFLTGLALVSQLELIFQFRNWDPCHPRLEAGNPNLHQNVTISLLQVRLTSTKGLKDEKSEQSSVSCDGLDDIVTNWTNLGVSGLSQIRDYHGNISGEECETIKAMFTNISEKQTIQHLLLFELYFPKINIGITLPIYGNNKDAEMSGGCDIISSCQ